MRNNSADYKIKKTPVLLKPYFYSKPSISAVTIKLFVLLSLQVLCLCIARSFNSVLIIASSTIAAVLSGTFVYLIRRTQPFTILSMMVQGMLIGMLVPDTFPFYTVFFFTFIVILIAQYIFINCVNSWVNLVCLVVVGCWFIGRQFFPQFLITSDLLSVKNPSLYLVQSGVFPTGNLDSAITDFFNNSVFGWFNVTLPNGLISLLIDTGSSIPAFRFNLLTLLSSIILFCDESLSKTIPCIFVITYLVLVRMFCPMMNGGEFNQGDMVLALYTSGTIFIAVFLLQWFGTHPITLVGKIVYGILAGVAAFLIVGVGTSPIGMCYTVLLCNIINLVIRVFEEKHNDRKLEKILLNDSGRGQ